MFRIYSSSARSILALLFLSAAVPAGGAAPDDTPPQQFRLLEYASGNFLERRRIYSGHVVHARRAEPPDFTGARVQGVAEVRALLELAEFDLAHGLAAEGQEALAALEVTYLETQTRRRLALELGFAAIDPRDVPVSEAAKALLENASGRWPDRPVLAAMLYWKAGDIEAAGQHVDSAAKRLYLYSEPFLRRTLPALLDIAVETRQWSTARRIAKHFVADPELAASSAYNFQLGRTAEAGGDHVAAFDRYLKAGSGNDLWAHRARVALIDLGMRTGTVSMADARELVSHASRMWTGDRYGLAVLKRLPEIDLALDDVLSALQGYATIMMRYPGSPDAAMVRQQARSLWSDFYERGANGELSLSEFLSGHRQIAGGFRFESDFDLRTEALADRFMAAGATMIAADEYRETRDFLLVSRDLGLARPSDRRLDALLLKQAEALHKGGQLDELSYLLAEDLQSDDPDLRQRFALLQASLNLDLGQNRGEIDAGAADSPVRYLRLRAAAFFGREDWTEAFRLYRMILERSEEDLTDGDAVRMFLAANRSGDHAGAVALAQRFQRLTGNPHWARIARSITEEAPALLPLRATTADQRLGTAEETLENIRALQPRTD